jgi:two-component system alkaline phosphatase synthesis response regulator PhoP
MNQNILIVEDDTDILELLRFSLDKEGYKVFFAVDGNEAWSILNDEHIDLCVFDIGLPGISGVELCRRIRREDRMKQIPIIFASARTQEADLLIGFQAGADDYVRKPFSPKELLARINVLLKRANSDGVYRLGTLEMYFDRHLVKIDQQRTNLTHREFGVLIALIQAHGRTISRSQLLEKVWGMDALSSPRSVDIVITRIREKIKPYQNCIRTISGIGYQWDPEEDVSSSIISPHETIPQPR